jgi:O-Antigen ligase
MRHQLKPTLQEPTIEWKYFLVIFLLLLTNFASLSVFINQIPPLRFLRQPSMVFALLFVMHYFPVRPVKKGFKVAVYFYVFFCIYLVFNTISSINPTNSISYAAWMLGIYVFIYQFLVVRNELPFREILFQFSAASASVGALFIALSYIGGYVFGIEDFFDERFNYTLMRMTTEFSGIFGSNNSFGMLTFLTSINLLFLYELTKGRQIAYFLLAGSVILSILLFFIGNRASMACGVAYWLLYFVWIYRSVAGSLVLLFVLVAGFGIFQEKLVQKLRLEQFEGGNILGNRSELIEEALAVANEMSFFGVGYHNQRQSRKYFELVGQDDKEYNFHNTFLAVYTELGYTGLLWIPGIVLFFLIKWSDHKKNKEDHRTIQMMKTLLLVMLLFYLPVEDSVNSPGSPTFITFWMTVVILGIGLSEKPKALSFEKNEEKNSLSHLPV